MQTHCTEAVRYMPLWKKLLFAFLALFGVALVGGAGFVAYQVMAYDRSLSKVYQVALPKLTASTDPALIARGQHLAESIGGCIECHGPGLGGKLMADMGPIGVIHAPNITQGGTGAQYSDAKLARLLRDGVKHDGTTVLFMPSGDFRWWPDADIIALVSWWRLQPAVQRASTPSKISVLGKVLDRVDLVPIDIARRIDHAETPLIAAAPSASAEYGKFLAKLCQGCHGVTFSGGPIPGAPPEMAVPSNLTPHETGLAGWSEADFYRVLNEGVRPDGRKLDPMMPLATLKAMNELEKKALWLYLRSLPKRPFGQR